MTVSVLYHCTCTSSDGFPPAPHLPSSSYAFHPLHTLFFCEECDLVRCNRCVAVEVSCYYCPNCLFEVPTASVRAEKNRCARNCFQCPHCRNTLAVVSSDPPEPLNGSSSAMMVGEAPFFLYCNYCRWDSTTVGITFEKPTGLALQLQKMEDSQPEGIEFERLKEHFEPMIRSSSGGPSQASQHQPHHQSAAQQAASSALSRDMPILRRSLGQRTTSNAKASTAAAASAVVKKTIKGEDFEREYKARIPIASGMGMILESELDWLRNLGREDTEGEGSGISAIAEVDKRWTESWAGSMKASELKPLRIPLHSKKSKRCPACTHILIKPEQKAQSVRYRIKLMAANYLPSIEARLDLPPASAVAASLARGKARGGVTASSATDDIPQLLQPGKSYAFQLAFMNPLYEPITVSLATHRPPTDGDADPAVRPAFAVALPPAPFPISAYAEAWEYEDDDEFDDDELEELLSGGAAISDTQGPGKKGKSSKGNVGVLERKANVTKIGGEFHVSREGSGEVKFNMHVSYTYRADEPASLSEESKPITKNSLVKDTAAGGEMKTFTFFTVINLGTIASRDRDKDKE